MPACVLPGQDGIKALVVVKEMYDQGELGRVRSVQASHPHLVNEFVRALIEDRDPWPNAVTAANWTCVGICAHQSAERGGQIVDLPDFTQPD